MIRHNHVPSTKIAGKTGPEPVGQSQPNGYSLFEMCEKVPEWCSDWFDAGNYAISPERSPPGPEEGTRKASRRILAAPRQGLMMFAAI